MRSSKEVNRRFYGVAEAQAGFWTAKQAKNAGFCRRAATCIPVQEGGISRNRPGRGRVPAALRRELTRWHLWAGTGLGAGLGRARDRGLSPFYRFGSILYAICAAPRWSSELAQDGGDGLSRERASRGLDRPTLGSPPAH